MIHDWYACSETSTKTMSDCLHGNHLREEEHGTAECLPIYKLKYYHNIVNKKSQIYVPHNNNSNSWDWYNTPKLKHIDVYIQWQMHLFFSHRANIWDVCFFHKYTNSSIKCWNFSMFNIFPPRPRGLNDQGSKQVQYHTTTTTNALHVRIMLCWKSKVPNSYQT